MKLTFQLTYMEACSENDENNHLACRYMNDSSRNRSDPDDTVKNNNAFKSKVNKSQDLLSIIFKNEEGVKQRTCIV